MESARTVTGFPLGFERLQLTGLGDSALLGPAGKRMGMHGTILPLPGGKGLRGSGPNDGAPNDGAPNGSAPNGSGPDGTGGWEHRQRSPRHLYSSWLVTPVALIVIAC